MPPAPLQAVARRTTRRQRISCSACSWTRSHPLDVCPRRVNASHEPLRVPSGARDRLIARRHDPHEQLARCPFLGATRVGPGGYLELSAWHPAMLEPEAHGAARAAVAARVHGAAVTAAAARAVD